MKKILLLLLLVGLSSCGSYNSIDSFYEAHKNDDHVTAIRVPQFMFALLSNADPEVQSLFGTTRDLRYMKFPSKTVARTEFFNKQMNNITSNSFVEVYRKNNETKRNVISIREKKNTVKEIIIYNNNNLNGSILYFNGNFDPVKVRAMAKNNKFEKFSENLIQEFSPNTPRISNE